MSSAISFDNEHLTSPSPRAKVRVALIDDHPVVRFGLSRMLSGDPGIDFAADFESVHAAIVGLADTPADIVLLDLGLEDTQGVESLRALREAMPEVKIIVYTSHDEEKQVVQAAELGVNGYLLKGCSQRELITGILSVHRGGMALAPIVAAQLMQHMNGRSRQKRQTEAFRFSQRERQVLELLAKGKTNRAIGAQLFISESTVKFHMHAILNKLDARNRTQAVSIAAQMGIIELEE